MGKSPDLAKLGVVRPQCKPSAMVKHIYIEIYMESFVRFFSKNNLYLYGPGHLKVPGAAHWSC